MKKLAPWLMGGLAVAAIGIALAFGLSVERPKGPQGPFELSQLKGEIGLVNVWATWCGPCRRELPNLLELADAYEKKGVHFVAVNADDGDRSVVDAFVREQPKTLRTHLAFPKDGFFDAIGIQALPTTLIVDRQGNVVKRFVGEIHPDEVRAALDQVLQGPSARAR